jgi:hypothetical protein
MPVNGDVSTPVAMPLCGGRPVPNEHCRLAGELVTLGNSALPQARENNPFSTFSFEVGDSLIQPPWIKHVYCGVNDTVFARAVGRSIPNLAGAFSADV